MKASLREALKNMEFSTSLVYLKMSIIDSHSPIIGISGF